MYGVVCFVLFVELEFVWFDVFFFEGFCWFFGVVLIVVVFGV